MRESLEYGRAPGRVSEGQNRDTHADTLAHAFPLSESGCFADLLKAIDESDQVVTLTVRQVIR